MCPLEPQSRRLMAIVAGDFNGEIRCIHKSQGCHGCCPQPIYSKINPETWDEKCNSNQLKEPEKKQKSA